MLLRLCFVCVLIVPWVLVFFLVCGVEHELLHRSMRSKLSCPFKTSFYPLSRQLGVEVEVELEVDLE